MSKLTTVLLEKRLLEVRCLGEASRLVLKAAQCTLSLLAGSPSIKGLQLEPQTGNAKNVVGTYYIGKLEPW